MSEAFEVTEDLTERARRLVADAAPPEDRKLPADTLMEVALLKVAMRSVTALDIAVAIVAVEHFSSVAHRAIWKAIVALQKSGEVVDSVTVASWLAERKRLESIGGVAYLNTIEEMNAEPEFTDRYAARIVSLATRRNLILTCQRLANDGFTATGDDYAEKVEREIFAATRSGRDGGTMSVVRDTVKAVMDKVMAGESATPFVSTGLRALDARIGGLHEKHLVIVAGRPGMGKTAIVGGVATHVAKTITGDHASAVLIMSAEMGREEIAQRMLSATAFVDGSKFDVPSTLTDDDLARLTKAADILGRYPIWVDEKAAPTIEHVRAQVRRVKAQTASLEFNGYPLKLRVVIVDHLQIVGTNKEDNQTRDRQVGAYSAALKELAKEEQICVVALSQINRGPEKQDNKRPTMTDLRDSGNLEQDADMVLFLYRDEYYHPPARPEDARKYVEIIVGKRRGGKSERQFAVAKFEGAFTLFRDLTPHEEMQLEEEQRSDAAASARTSRESPTARRWKGKS